MFKKIIRNVGNFFKDNINLIIISLLILIFFTNIILIFLTSRYNNKNSKLIEDIEENVIILSISEKLVAESQIVIIDNQKEIIENQKNISEKFENYENDDTYLKTCLGNIIEKIDVIEKNSKNNVKNIPPRVINKKEDKKVGDTENKNIKNEVVEENKVIIEKNEEVVYNDLIEVPMDEFLPAESFLIPAVDNPEENRLRHAIRRLLYKYEVKTMEDIYGMESKKYDKWTEEYSTFIKDCNSGVYSRKSFFRRIFGK